MNKLFKISSLVFITAVQFGCGGKGTSFGLSSTNDSFGQVVVINNKVDILFVIDNSTSMAQYQQRLSAKVPQMISSLNSLKMDYHVGVTTSTMAADTVRYPMTRQIIGSPKYLTSQNINLLQSRLIVGETGSDLERSLDSMQFVTGSYAATDAPGFLRKDALFAVIFLSDEEDSSTNSNSNDFIDYMNQLKPPFAEGGQSWIANFIGTIDNQNCDFLGGHPSIGFNILRLVDASNGIKESICSADLANAISNIKSRVISQLTSFPLKSAPNKSTIKVFISGRAIVEEAVNGWTLEIVTVGTQKKYFIKFHGTSVPAADEVVQVDFTPMGAS